MGGSQWGAIFAIRTGPAEYAKQVVQGAWRLQRKCDEGHVVSTALVTNGQTIDTPEEDDFFRACGVQRILPPHLRSYIQR